MPFSEAAQFVYEHVLPQATDVQAAKGTIMEYMKDQPRGTAVAVGYLFTEVRKRLAPSTGPVPPGYSSVKPDLHELRAELAAREALQQLHGQGALLAHGQFTTSGGADERSISGVTPHYSGPISDVRIPVPEVRHGYSLAAAYAGEQFVLADGDIYLSQVNRGALPSRVRRCLAEAVTSYQHGAYLSASMNLGAASEALWLRLGKLMQDKGFPGRKTLDQELGKPYPSAGALMDAAWGVLKQQGGTQLKQVFPTTGDRIGFMQLARELRDRRNYAMHSEEADEEEALFRYNETSVLLLASVKYFNQLLALIDAVEAAGSRVGSAE